MEENKEFIETEKIQDNLTNNVEHIEKPKDKKGMAIAAMILGIVAIVLCLIWYISIPCGILAIIFGAMALKSTNRGMALSGVITGGIGILLTIIIIAVLVMSVISIYNDAVDSTYYDDWSSYYNEYY